MIDRKVLLQILYAGAHVVHSRLRVISKGGGKNNQQQQQNKRYCI